MLKLCYRKTCISTKYNQKVKWWPLCHLHHRASFTHYSVVSVIASIFASAIGPLSCPSLVHRCTVHCCHVHCACIIAPGVRTSLHPLCVCHHVYRCACRAPSPAVGELFCPRWCTIMYRRLSQNERVLRGHGYFASTQTR